MLYFPSTLLRFVDSMKNSREKDFEVKREEKFASRICHLVAVQSPDPFDKR